MEKYWTKTTMAQFEKDMKTSILFKKVEEGIDLSFEEGKIHSILFGQALGRMELRQMINKILAR